jgi:hypothetical protein
MPAFVALRVLAFVGLLATVQAQERSAAELIRLWKRQSDQLGIFSCGMENADRAVATSLAKLGQSALPDIGSELDSIEKNGNRAREPWIELAYARIKGPAAYSRLRRMVGDPKLGVDRNNLDFPSLYRSLSHPTCRIPACCSGTFIAGEPRSRVTPWIS